MIVHTMNGAYAGQWLLGQESAISPEQQAADLAPISPGQSANVPSMPYQDPFASGGGGGGGGGIPSLDTIKKGIDVGKQAYDFFTNSGGSTPTTPKAGIKYVCKALYDKCKTFTTNPTQQAKYKTLLAAQVASPAWKTYQQENTACGAKYTSGGFGAFKVGDAKGNAAAYKLYQACGQAAVAKYRTASAKEQANLLWVSTFREAANYVTSTDKMRANGAEIRDSKCVSLAEKNLMTRVTSASVATSTYLIGALVLVGAGVAAWYVL